LRCVAILPGGVPFSGRLFSDGPPEDAGDDPDLDVDVVDEAAGQGDAA
jgi:hypothetical protein